LLVSSLDSWRRSVAAMRDRIEHELGVASDLKAGAGGIIDVEFAAQCLQHVLAPARALDLLGEGYQFLRGIEHRLRVVHDAPIYRSPDSRPELDKLARRCGMADGAVLHAHLERLQRGVRAAYVELLSA
jgi:glutamate-ammonia-ligase adenylyltransferase